MPPMPGMSSARVPATPPGPQMPPAPPAPIVSAPPAPPSFPTLPTAAPVPTMAPSFPAPAASVASPSYPQPQGYPGGPVYGGAPQQQPQYGGAPPQQQPQYGGATAQQQQPQYGAQQQPQYGGGGYQNASLQQSFGQMVCLYLMFNWIMHLRIFLDSTSHLVMASWATLLICLTIRTLSVIFLTFLSRSTRTWRIMRLESILSEFFNFYLVQSGSENAQKCFSAFSGLHWMPCLAMKRFSRRVGCPLALLCIRSEIWRWLLLSIHYYYFFQNLNIIQTSTIVRCRYCRTYINPFVTIPDMRHWKCNLCNRNNDCKLIFYLFSTIFHFDSCIFLFVAWFFQCPMISAGILLLNLTVIRKIDLKSGMLPSNSLLHRNTWLVVLLQISHLFVRIQPVRKNKNNQNEVGYQCPHGNLCLGKILGWTDFAFLPEIAHAHPCYQINIHVVQLRPPQPAVYVFLIDVSATAIESGLSCSCPLTLFFSLGYLYAFTEQILINLDQLPGDDRTQVAFIGVDACVHFFQFEADCPPRQMIVDDVDGIYSFSRLSWFPIPAEFFTLRFIDIYLPTNSGLLVNLKKNKETVRNFLQQLPTIFEKPTSSHNCLGAALTAAKEMIVSFSWITFTSSFRWMSEAEYPSSNALSLIWVLVHWNREKIPIRGPPRKCKTWALPRTSTNGCLWSVLASRSQWICSHSIRSTRISPLFVSSRLSTFLINDYSRDRQILNGLHLPFPQL